MELQRKTIKFNILEHKEEDFEGVPCFTFKGYASTFGNKDLGDDICIAGCFRKSLEKRIPKLLWQHDMDEPVGVFVNVTEDEKGLFVDARLPKEDTLVAGRIIPQMKVGSIDSMSIGYSVEDFEMVKQADNSFVRFLKELTLWEISLVTLPMNTMAMVTDMKNNVVNEELPYKSLVEVSKTLKEYFTKREADNLIFSIKKLCTCNESKEQPCNEVVDSSVTEKQVSSEIIATEFEAYLENLKSINL
jgi:uncharacterized protein